jgi:hypothetical protein
VQTVQGAGDWRHLSQMKEVTSDLRVVICSSCDRFTDAADTLPTSLWKFPEGDITVIKA